MKHRFIAASAALMLTTLIAGCATTEDTNYASMPYALREQPTGSRIPRVRKPVTEQERRQAQADAETMRQQMQADRLTNQGK